MVWRVFICVAAVALCVTPSSADAAFPGENGKISFFRYQAGEIRTVNPDGTGEAALPPGSRSRPGFARWSPDGTRFASHLLDECGEFACRYSIATYAADGTDERVVAGLGFSENPPYPSFSPDGTELAYGLNWQLRAIEVDGGNDRLLSSECSPVWTPAWSPVGARATIAFERETCSSGSTARGIEFFCSPPSPFEGCSGGIRQRTPRPGLMVARRQEDRLHPHHERRAV